MARRLFATLIGLAVAVAVVVAVEYVDARLYPPRARLDFNDKAAMAAYIAGLPFVALALVQFGWFLATFVGGSVAMRLHAGVPRARPALMVALALLVAAVVDMAQFPHPAWSWIATFATIPAGAWMAVRFNPRPAGRPPSGTHARPM